MLFSVLDRLMLNVLVPKMIPPMASRALYAQFDALGNALGFGEEEIDEIELELTDGAKWNAQKACDKEVEIGPSLVKVIAAGFKRMDEAGELPREAMGVFDKFVPAEEWAEEK